MKKNTQVDNLRFLKLIKSLKITNPQEALKKSGINHSEFSTRMKVILTYIGEVIENKWGDNIDALKEHYTTPANLVTQIDAFSIILKNIDFYLDYLKTSYENYLKNEEENEKMNGFYGCIAPLTIIQFERVCDCLELPEIKAEREALIKNSEFRKSSRDVINAQFRVLSKKLCAKLSELTFEQFSEKMSKKTNLLGVDYYESPPCGRVGTMMTKNGFKFYGDQKLEKILERKLKSAEELLVKHGYLVTLAQNK